MTITAKIVADSISKNSPRLTTFQLKYPRFIHGEFMTHRDFSRNASSSRAIPVKRLIQDVMDDPAMPIHWGANQKGMQADKECDNFLDLSYPAITGKNFSSKDAWLKARDTAIAYATSFDNAGYHKQIVNRLLEPFCHINVICTATRYSNFFALRRHKDAQPEIRVLADAMWEAMEKSDPVFREPGSWHLPYVTLDDWTGLQCRVCMIHDLAVDLGRRVSVARCARVSYLTQEGKEPSIEEDLKLYDRLVGSVPLHASPAEHQATPISGDDLEDLGGNLGEFWIQYRKTLSGECQ